jgi:protein involved in polysaccharide export with SLBB domain
MQKVVDDDTMGYFEDSDILCDIGRGAMSEVYVTRKNRAYSCRLIGQVAIAAMLLFTSAFVSAQQTGSFPQLPGGGDFQGQANCGDPYSSCTSGADRSGGANTNTDQYGNSYMWPYDSSQPYQGQGMDTENPDFGTRRPFQSTVPYPITGPGPDRLTDPRAMESKRKEEPPTEFQLFVAGAIGKVLPNFGSQLFLTVPSTFAPLNKGPVPPDYVVGPGDELLLRAWGSLSFNVRERIDRDGNIYLPHFGELRVAGLKSSELNSVLTERIGQEFRKFELSVSLGDLRSIQVLVVGRARRPGSYTIGSMSTLVDVLFASGGPSSTGSMRKIELRRNGKTITTVDLYQVLAEGDGSKDAHLLSGDVIYIPSAGPRVAIAGSVNQPAIYELLDGDTVGTAVNLAGGVSSIAALERAELERVSPDGGRHMAEIKLDQAGMRALLINGDILNISQIVPKFDNAVILRGNVANPGRYAWHAGMRIRDLIPDKESLVTRAALTGHNALALTESERDTAQRVRKASLAIPDTRGGSQAAGPPGSQPTGNSSVQVTTGDTSVQVNNDHGTTSSTNANTLPDDLSTGQEDKNDNPTETPNSGSSTGRSIALDTGGPSDEFTQKNQVRLTAPEINWDYAVIERTNPDDLTTVLKPFHLGRVILGHDDTENFELQPGDVVTIFSQADLRVPQNRQTKLVRLEGEFGAAGVYSVKPGETLRDLVIRAGGLTPNAYLYGSSFTRRSTKLQQQARLDEYTFDLESEIERESGNRSTSVVNPQEALVVAGSLQSQRALVAKLRTIRASGRIVLNMHPTSTDVSSIPDLPLQDGDTFLVPSRPASVSVVGAVYDQSSFLFQDSANVNHYLELSGGVSKSGDWKHSFVLRADGSVVSQSSSLAHASHGLEHFELNPGDTVFVPEVLNKTTFVRGLTDWSSILAQFGLGAAAVNVLR